MLLVIHIIIALASAGMATYTFFRPSGNLINISYISIITTLLSGIALIFSNQTYLAHVCVAGLIYSTITLSLVLLAKKRLSPQIN